MQTEFNFINVGTVPKTPAPATPDGLSRWRDEREQAIRAFAIKLGLPVDHLVEVRLKDGVILRGNLRVGDVVLSLEYLDRGKLALEVDGLVFYYRELDSCVRLD